MRPDTEIWKTIPIVGLLLLPTIGGAVQFSCPQKGVVTNWKIKETQTGEVFCAKQKFTFSGSIALPDPQKGKVYTLQCKPNKGGDK